MIYSSIKPYIAYNDISVTTSPVGGKLLSIMVLSENDDTLNSIKSSKFTGNGIRKYIVPTSPAPFRTYMNSDYKVGIKDAGFVPIKANINELKSFDKFHMYIDSNRYFDAIIDRYNVKVFNHQKFRELMSSYFKLLCNNSPSNSEKVLLYTLNTDLEFSEKLLNKKFLPLYLIMIKNIKNIDSEIPFDKIIYCEYSPTNGTKEYKLIYQKSVNTNINKIRSIITSSKPSLTDKSIVDTDLNFVANEFDEDEMSDAMNFEESYYSPWVDGAYTFNEIGAAIGAAARFLPKLAGVGLRKGGAAAARSGVAPKWIGNSMTSAGRNLMRKPLRATAGMGVAGYTYYDLANMVRGKPEEPQGPSILQRAKNGATAVANGYRQLSPTAQTATAVAGGLAAAGTAASVLWKRHQARKQEKYTEQGCANLTGGKQQACINYMNKLKLSNIDGLLQHCQGDPQCVKSLQDERAQVMDAMQKGVLF